MLPGPPELEKRCRRFLEGKGDAVAPLLCFLGSDRDARAGSGAWAAVIVSRIFLLKGNVPLAHCYLRIAAARSNEACDAALRLGILVNKALILKAQGNVSRAAELLRAVVDRALREGETFVAAKAAANLALCLARSGAVDADSYLGLAERAYSAAGYETGLVRLSMIRALVEAKRGSRDDAVERTSAALRACGEERFARERAIGTLLLAELFLENGDLPAAREALDRAGSMKEAFELFGPQRLTLRRLEADFDRMSGRAHESFDDGRAGAGCIAREASPGARFDVPPALKVMQSHRREAAADIAETFLTCDPRTARMLAEIERAAPLPVPILIEGESGTGKELVARLVHAWSRREREPFVPVNAAAIPAELFESMAFGHARGAFTGAVDVRAGFAAAAGRGTLFLDEIGELPPALQAKLLRLIDRREYIPLGETKPRRFEARIVAATNRDLRADCAAGRFRGDLYYRLAPLAFRIPPLRERPADIEHLARRFAERLRTLHGIGPGALHESAIAALVRHRWPGNARELDSEILRGALAARGGAIRVCHLSPAIIMGAARGASPACDGLTAQLTALARDEILQALRDCDGNRTHAARRLGMKRTTLLSAMRRHGIE